MSTRGDYQLKFPVGRFEDQVVTLIIATQMAIGIAAVLTFAFWFLAAPSNEGYWYPEILALSLGAGVAAYLLKYLYRRE